MGLVKESSARELGEIDARAQRSERAQHMLAFYGSLNGHPKDWVEKSTVNRIRALLVDLKQLSDDHGVDIRELI